MANLIAAKSQQSSFHAFADRKQIAEDGTRFCIDSAKLVTQKDGKVRWYLDIRYLEDGEVATRTLTFDTSPSRDEMFTDLADSNDFPQHCCWIEKRTFKNKGTGMMQTFYNLEQETGRGQACACNLTDSTALEVEGDSADPFVPDFSDEA